MSVIRALAVDGGEDVRELGFELRGLGHGDRHVERRGDARAEEASLVHPAYALAYERRDRQPVARVELRLVEGLEEVEGAARGQQRGVEDLLRLDGHEPEEALAIDEAELDGRLAEAQVLA